MSLHRKLIKLGYQRPELRKHLRPVLDTLTMLKCSKVLHFPTRYDLDDLSESDEIVLYHGTSRKHAYTMAQGIDATKPPESRPHSPGGGDKSGVFVTPDFQHAQEVGGPVVLELRMPARLLYGVDNYGWTGPDLQARGLKQDLLNAASFDYPKSFRPFLSYSLAGFPGLHMKERQALFRGKLTQDRILRIHDDTYGLRRDWKPEEYIAWYENLEGLNTKQSSMGARQHLDRNEFNDSIDYQFAQYALNEQTFRLSDSQIERAKAKYGGLAGVKGGLIYHGGRINSKDRLDTLRKLENGGTIEVHFKSFSHFKSQAREFANFVKTYDAMVGMRQLEKALERGSAGKFGSYIMVAEADEDTVVINSRNPNVTRSVEDELIVHGRVKVKEVEIIEPLTKDTWVDKTLGRWNSLEDLKSASFVSEWLRKHHIDPWKHGFGGWLYDHTRDFRSLTKFLTEMKHVSMVSDFKGDSYNSWILRHPLVDRLKEEVVVEGGRGQYPKLLLDGTQVSVGKDLYQEIMRQKGSGTLREKYRKARKRVDDDLSDLKRLKTGRFPTVDEWQFYSLKNYVTVLNLLVETGLYERHMSKPVKRLLSLIRKSSEIPLTDENWKDQFIFIDSLAHTFGSIHKPFYRELDKKLGLRKGFILTFKTFVGNNYEKLNRRENNDLKEFPRILRELPDALKNVMGLL